MQRKIILAGSGAFFSLLPLCALAATSVTGTNLEGVISSMGPLIARITQILDAFALLGFFWGLSMYIWNAQDEKKRAQGRTVMLWGIVAIFILTSIAGLIGVLQTTFSLGGNPPIIPPSADPKQYNIGI